MKKFRKDENRKNRTAFNFFAPNSIRNQFPVKRGRKENKYCYFNPLNSTSGGNRVQLEHFFLSPYKYFQNLRESTANRRINKWKEKVGRNFLPSCRLKGLPLIPYAEPLTYFGAACESFLFFSLPFSLPSATDFLRLT